MSKLKNYCNIYTGNSISDSNKDNYNFVDGAIPYISTKDIDLKTSEIDYSNGMFVKEDIDKFKIAPKNSTLLCIEGGSAGKKIGYLKEDVCFVNKLCCFSNFKGNSRFLYYYLQSDNFLSIFNLNMTGLIGGVSQSIIKNILVDFPNQNKQTKIADYLDEKCSKIDKVIKDNKKEIELLEEYKKSAISKFIKIGLRKEKLKETNIPYIGKIPSSWKCVKFDRLFEITKRIAGSEGYDVLSITQGGIKIKDIESNEGQLAANYSNYQFVDIGDFAMNHMDLLTGWVDCSKYNGVTSPDYRVFKLKSDKLADKRYCLYYLQLCYKERIFYGFGQGVSNLGRWRLPKDEFLGIYIPLPKLEEQLQICDYLDKHISLIDRVIEYRKKIIEKLEEYKKSLIYEVVTGKKEV